MDTLFLKILNMSISALWLILAVILLRLVLKKVPKWINVLLWALVAVRLLCPISFESPLSLVPNAEPIPQEIFVAEPPQNHESPVFHPIENPNLPDTPPVSVDGSIEQIQWKFVFATFGWAFGVVAMLVYAIISYLRVKGKVKASLHLWDNIWICDDISTPFILGVFIPKIYIPSGVDESQLPHIIAHENAHLKRLDHWWKPLGFAVLAVHWFNPLVWVAYILLCRDIELACDEKVIRKMNQSESIAYSETLLSCSVNRRMVMVCPIAFGEVGVKERVKRVLHYRKPAFWLIVSAVIVCIVVAICFLTNPSKDEKDIPEPFGHAYKVDEILFHDPQYSFAYSIDTAPRYQFTSDYGMFVSENVLSQGGTVEWVQQKGGFEEVKVTTENFDNYFDMSGFQISNDSWSEFRSSIKKAWRFDIENDENHVFYYLISTKTGEVYLTYGYRDPEGETDPHSDDSRIHRLFKLARTDLLTCNIISEGIHSFVEPVCFPDNIDRDTDNLPVAKINKSGTLQFAPDGDANILVVSEDYYRKCEDATFIDRNTFEIKRNDDGFFTIDITYRESLEDHVNYFVQIKGQSDVYAMKVVFVTPPDGNTPDGNMIEETVEPTESTPSTADGEGSTADPTESDPQETGALIGPSGVKLRTSDKLIYLAPKAGYLEFSFDNARAVNHRSDVQEEYLLLSECSRLYWYDASQYSAEDFPGARDVSIFQEETLYVRYDYPDWTEEDGYFGDDIYLILVDVTATSVGAEMHTNSDDHPGGPFDDPYIFDATPVPVLTDISGTYWLNENSRLWYEQPVYFSLLNQRSEHPFAFRLAPGESITYTLGFLVTDYELGGYFSLPHLCFNDTMGSLDGAFYKLDIDWSATR